MTALLLLCGSASASDRPVPDEQQLIQLSYEWMSAIERKDRPALERIVARDFVLQKPGDPPAQAVRREEWITNAIGMDWSGFRYENPEIIIHGDRATVTARLHFSVSSMPVALDSTVVDLWQKRDGRWQVTNRYLGESAMQLRIAFVAGILATVITGLIVYFAVRMVRRRRRSRPA
jgi:ketosteroid isomerase-like protein